MWSLVVVIVLMVLFVAILVRHRFGLRGNRFASCPVIWQGDQED